MKTIITIITTVVFLFVSAVNAQEFTGKAIYKTSSKSTIKFGKDQKGIDDKMQEELKKRLQKMNQKTFILEFDKNSSTYKEDEQLQAPNPQAGNKIGVFSFGGSGSGSIYYKNIRENRFSNQTEIQGKRFLVKDTLKDFEWELSSETKNIGNYTCYKATFTKEVENTNTTMKDGVLLKEIKKETIVTTAWYTLQVAMNNGPANYQGLPGLILEINDGKKLIVCTEITLNPSVKITIQEPKKGKVVSQKKYLKIQKEKSDEMMEKFKGRNGLDLGNGVNIKIGG
ncbi:GLPGLI family protein [Polaribacter sp. IC066]|uniref:GLPGLI family protein n=1 Tax=Polaribacter sp. IC066 TaxID=57032 RepID=UPI0011BF16F5|nr:GLPGLI family protein [Polaribacter sp. IC066]TXD62320.1 GLPGLI family protein [Polaribacter sp. IC066]